MDAQKLFVHYFNRYCLQFARKLTFVKLSIPLNCDKGTVAETKRVALRTLFHQVKEIGNNRYKRINSFVVGSLYWMEFHNTSTNGYLFNTRRSIHIFFLSPYFLSFVTSASPRFREKTRMGNNICVAVILVIKFIRICTSRESR